MSFLGLFNRSVGLGLDGFTDWHCHILPGVDDGVQSIDESLDILADYEAAGIKEVWLTPHIMEDMPNTPADLRARFDELRTLYTGPVTLHLAAENMIDNLFAERLDAGDLLPIGLAEPTLLVETSYYNAPMGLFDTFEAIRDKGFIPLLAHPERYNYIDSPAEYRRIRDLGVLFQLNLMSLCGYYGPMVKRKALDLLAEGMYDRTGTDLHGRHHLDIIRGMKLHRTVADRLALLFPR